MRAASSTLPTTASSIGGAIGDAGRFRLLGLSALLRHLRAFGHVSSDCFAARHRRVCGARHLRYQRGRRARDGRRDLHGRQDRAGYLHAGMVGLSAAGRYRQHPMGGRRRRRLVPGCRRARSRQCRRRADLDLAALRAGNIRWISRHRRRLRARRAGPRQARDDNAMTVPLYMLSDVWNDAAQAFTAIRMNVTDTGHANGSLLLDLQRNGVSQFSVGPDGALTILSDVKFIRDTSGAPGAQPGNALALRNGTNPQTLRVYNTYTDDNNFERAFYGWIAAPNVLGI